ncbi:MAG: DUF262 domain-containing HNH endonuclease family protein [Filomicrobium sp.]
MSHPLPTASLTLEQLLAESNCFSVPIYQRPYSWTADEAVQLLEDVSTAAGLGEDAEPDSDYFLGTILLLETKTRGAPAKPGATDLRALEIVDGQQRLVTLTILASVLRELETDTGSQTALRLDSIVRPNSNANDLPRTRLALSESDQRFFAEHVQQLGSIKLEVEDQTKLSIGQKAILTARNKLRSELDNLTLEQRSELASYLCAKCHFVVVITADIDSAHRIFMILNDRGSPLLKKDILKAEILKAIPGSERERASFVWTQTERALGHEMETFLSQLRTVRGHGRRDVIDGVRRLVKEVGGAAAFIDTVLQPLGQAFAQILNADAAASAELDPAIRRPLITLQRLPGRDWVPAALLVLTRISDPSTAAAYLNEIERAAFLLRLLCLGAGKRQTRFIKITSALSETSLPGPQSLFEPSQEELRKISFNLRSLHERNAQICKALLLRLNDEIEPAALSAKPSDYTIEHVLPQRPKATSIWKTWYPDPEVRAAMTTSLGNLVLIPQGLNDLARNDEFARKKEVYSSGKSGTRLLESTAAVLRNDTWQADAVRQRESALINQMNAIWRLNLEPALDGGTLV